MSHHNIAREVLYRGRVQGVGFRFNARHIARRFDVSGFVRNLEDGRVQLVAVGAASQVEGFLAAVAESMEANIVDAVVTDTVPGQYDSFEIRT